MEIDAFSRRQQFPYFRHSLLKLGQSCERHLDFNKRKDDQANLIVNYFNIIRSLYYGQQKANVPIFCSGLFAFCKEFTVVPTALPHLSWWTEILSTICFVMNLRCFPFLQKWSAQTWGNVFWRHVRQAEASQIKLALASRLGWARGPWERHKLPVSSG